MSHSTITLKRLLERSHRCEGDTYCIKLSPRLLYKGNEEGSLRFNNLIETEKDELISNMSISEDCSTAYYTVTPKGWYAIEGENYISSAWHLPLMPDQELELICLADTIDDNSLNLLKQSNLIFCRPLKPVIINQNLLKEYN